MKKGAPDKIEKGALVKIYNSVGFVVSAPKTGLVSVYLYGYDREYILNRDSLVPLE